MTLRVWLWTAEGAAVPFRDIDDRLFHDQIARGEQLGAIVARGRRVLVVNAENVAAFVVEAAPAEAGQEDAG